MSVAVERLLALGTPAAALRAAARERALGYINAVRSADPGLLSAQNLLNSFPLATPEGIALLRLAEALLRAPDADTQTWLIAEKLAAFRTARVGLDSNFVTRVLAAALKLAGHTAADADLREADNDRYVEHDRNHDRHEHHGHRYRHNNRLYVGYDHWLDQRYDNGFDDRHNFRYNLRHHDHFRHDDWHHHRYHVGHHDHGHYDRHDHGYDEWHDQRYHDRKSPTWILRVT